MTFRIAFLLTALLGVAWPAQAFESDVHFGLTQWLALKAGFTEAQAETIATGNQRSDSGVMDSVELVLEYACLGAHADAAQVAQSYHFPSEGKPPAAPAQRAIVAGGAVARRPLNAVQADAAKGKADFLLYKLGEALHLLQDSWSYQGVPATPVFPSSPVRCDPQLAWTAPEARGGWASHRADLSKAWPEDTLAMAEASYRALTQYPAVAGKARTPQDWAAVRAPLAGFIQGASKTEKRRWFVAQGMHNTRFLDSISLPDGKQPVATVMGADGRRLPALASGGTAQHGLDTDTRQFFDLFFARWLGTDSPDAGLRELVSLQRQPDLRARLKLWRMRDHGAVAELAHSPAPLTAAQQQTVDRLAGQARAYARYGQLSEAFFPLLLQGPGVSPLLPYAIHGLPPSSEGLARAIAVAKLRHVPYDELAILAEKGPKGWRAVQLIAMVNH